MHEIVMRLARAKLGIPVATQFASANSKFLFPRLNKAVAPLFRQLSASSFSLFHSTTEKQSII